jgi:crossover junction endonuclease MUS81
MNYIIKFDNREKDLIKILELKDYHMTLENLDIGDIQFVDINTKEILILIERKTLSDLCSSIKDGRYKEQKERMLYSIKKNVRKIILIEGNDLSTFSLPLSTLKSVIINTLIRDNIHIHLTDNKNETIEFIEDIILNLPKYYEDLEKEIIHGESKTYENKYNCNTSKKENLTVDICFRNMLSQIPGVSNTISSIYVSKYKTMENFITKIKEESNNDKNNIINLLSNEKYGKNNRKIGTKLGEKIYNYIFNSNFNIPEIKISNKKIIETTFLFSK